MEGVLSFTGKLHRVEETRHQKTAAITRKHCSYNNHCQQVAQLLKLQQLSLPVGGVKRNGKMVISLLKKRQTSVPKLVWGHMVAVMKKANFKHHYISKSC